jgi:hypothetical protein
MSSQGATFDPQHLYLLLRPFYFLAYIGIEL